ncbi:DUF3887 domain-containing protein [Streptomyces sp. MK5]|uniref:DUF3887 domain-containing protein n=1 Tax=Streptomyces sp. MK5 TaxID=3064253 RepID=UPI002741827D|nr:DUF3887 domain-containing protein [Streptomyces sp. MK5]
MSDSEDNAPGAADAADRQVMAWTLKTNAELAVSVLMGDRETGGEPVLAALAASRGLARVVDDIQRSLVRQARNRGLSWAAIGEMLHVTRQAAFQRFGGPGETAGPGDTPEAAALLPGAAEEALRVLALFTEQRWEEMRSRFDARMAQAAPADLLRTVWQKADRERGAFRTMGTPSVRAVSGYTVVDVPMAYERGELLRRVAFNADGQVAGFFALPAETERS